MLGDEGENPGWPECIREYMQHKLKLANTATCITHQLSWNHGEATTEQTISYQLGLCNISVIYISIELEQELYSIL